MKIDCEIEVRSDLHSVLEIHLKLESDIKLDYSSGSICRFELRGGI